MSAAAARHPDGDLTYAINRLRHAINRLTEPTRQYRGNRYHEAPGLYTQLRDSIVGEQGTGNGTARSMPPLWVDAADNLHNIDLMVSIWQPGYRGVPPTIARLRHIARRTWSTEQTRSVHKMAGIIDAWADDIERLLSPASVKHISAPCPACGAETAYHRDSAGETVRNPALQLTAHGCECQNCHTTWAPDRYLWLCRVLGFELPAGVLE
jgi:hypothetical protein